MIDRSIDPKNWKNLSVKITAINANSIKSFIENISSSMYLRSFGSNSSPAYYVYVAFNPIKIDLRGNKVVVNLLERSNRYPLSNYVDKYTNILSILLKNELSSKSNVYTPYDIEVIDSTKIKIKNITIVVKLYVDVTKSERSQIGYIKSTLKKAFDSTDSFNVINFKIDGDSYSITLFGENDIHYYVSEVGRDNNKADVLIKTDQGPVYISLKGTSYRQFSGLEGLRSYPEVQDFLTKLSKVNGSKVGYYKVIKDVELIQKSMYGVNYGSPSYGLNNVNYIFFGNITFNDNSFGASTKVLKKGEIVDIAYLVSSYSERNTVGVNNQVLNNIRIGIYDKRYMNASNEIT